jgi:hypothetical protein
MLATYYRFTEGETDDKTTLLNSIQEIDKKLERRKKRLRDEEITYELYLEFKAEYEKEKKELLDELAKCGKGVSNPQEYIDFALDYSLKLPSLWSSAGYTEQQRLQFLIFPEGILYDRKKDKCRTDNANGAFQYIAELKRLLEEFKSRTSLKKLEGAALVVPSRIELEYQVPETCVLSIVLRDQGRISNKEQGISNIEVNSATLLRAATNVRQPPQIPQKEHGPTYAGPCRRHTSVYHYI